MGKLAGPRVNPEGLLATPRRAWLTRTFSFYLDSPDLVSESIWLSPFLISQSSEVQAAA